MTAVEQQELSNVGRIVSPPRGDLDRLRPPLEEGERLVFAFFDEHLAPEWEIYLQPHLNNLRPDVVLLNPAAGIAVFEVKDWDLTACDWRIERQATRTPLLVGTDVAGRRFTKPNPFERLHQYRLEISELYCPALNRRAGLACVSAGLIFPFADDDELDDRFGAGLLHRAPNAAARRYLTLTAAGALNRGDISSVFPDHDRRGSQLMTEAVAADLRHWLTEPDFAAEQREAPRLSPDQHRYVNSRTESGYRRLKGPAGSGKTLVVAGRAATLANDGKDVLVVSFNVSLLNYLRDCAARFGPAKNRIAWLNFHAWCKRVLYGVGRADLYHSLPWRTATQDVFDELLAAAASEAIDADRESVDRYDAILVDEGQDFRPSWWNALRKTLRPDGEMLLTADRAQDVYGRNDLWTERAMEGAGFQGRWATLEISYRMPTPLLELTAEFAKRFLDDGDVARSAASDQQELDVDECSLRWVQANAQALPEAAVEAVRTSLADSQTNGSPTAFADVVLICDRIELGRMIVGGLSVLGVQVQHTFAADRDLERQQKHHFFKGDARVKATTIHSFKGWEGRHLIVAVGDVGSKRARSVLYTAMTRLKAHPSRSHLTVVCAAPSLEAFGRTWPEFLRS